jgi:hypothetical protein
MRPFSWACFLIKNLCRSPSSVITAPPRAVTQGYKPEAWQANHFPLFQTFPVFGCALDTIKNTLEAGLEKNTVSLDPYPRNGMKVAFLLFGGRREHGKSPSGIFLQPQKKLQEIH